MMGPLGYYSLPEKLRLTLVNLDQKEFERLCDDEGNFKPFKKFRFDEWGSLILTEGQIVDAIRAFLSDEARTTTMQMVADGWDGLFSFGSAGRVVGGWGRARSRTRWRRWTRC